MEIPTHSAISRVAVGAMTGEPAGRGGCKICWESSSLDELDSVDWLPADLMLIEKLRKKVKIL